MPKVETNCSTPKHSPTLTSPNTLVRMNPGANTATSTKRKYQPMNSTVTGTTKEAKRRRSVLNSRLRWTTS